MKQTWDIKQIWAKAQTCPDPFLVLLKEKVHLSHIFIILAASLLIDVGVLKLMRAVTDDYTAVATNFIHLLLTSVIWLCTLLVFAALIFKLSAEKPLTNRSAALFVMAVLGLLFLANRTYQTYSYIPRDHMREEAASAAQTVDELSKRLPLKINDDISEQAALLTGSTLVLKYTINKMNEHNWMADDLRPQLTPQACDYLNRFSKYETIAAVRYSFSGDDKNFNILFKTEDCAALPVPASPSPAVELPEKIIP